MSAAAKKQQTPQTQPTAQPPQQPIPLHQQARAAATPAGQHPVATVPQVTQHTVAPPQHPQTAAAAAAQQAQYAEYYRNYYSQYAATYSAPTWPTQQARAAAVPAAQPAAAPQQPAAPALDTADVATLNDALGSAGVDLRAEEENLRSSHQTSQTQNQASQPRGAQRSRAKKQGKKVVFDPVHLGTKMRTVAARHGLQTGTNGVPEDSVSYLGLALRARLAKLIEVMIAAAAHREETDATRAPGLYEDGTPMWSVVVRKDIAKQLAALEKVDKEEETAARRDRKAREAYAAGGQPALPSLDDALQMEQESEEPKKKKKKPDGPGVTAKNMSEDMKKKLSNATAAQAAGLSTSKYAWMNAGNLGAAARPAAKKATGTGSSSSTPAASASSGWAKPFQTTKKKDEPATEEDTRRAIIMKDAIFAVERERGHGGGRGSARGWT